MILMSQGLSLVVLLDCIVKGMVFLCATFYLLQVLGFQL